MGLGLLLTPSLLPRGRAMVLEEEKKVQTGEDVGTLTGSQGQTTARLCQLRILCMDPRGPALLWLHTLCQRSPKPHWVQTYPTPGVQHRFRGTYKA